MLHLLIDDTRDLGYPLIARNAQIARILLSSNIKFDSVGFDNDLGDISDQDGYDLMKWMIEDQKIMPPTIQILTSNPAAQQRMQQLLLKNNYQKKDNMTFTLVTETKKA